MNAKDRYKLMFDLVANAGGIDQIDLASEFSKAMSAIEKLRVGANIAQPQINASVAPASNAGGAIAQPPMDTATQDPNALNQPQNEGNGTLNLPPQM